MVARKKDPRERNEDGSAKDPAAVSPQGARPGAAAAEGLTPRNQFQQSLRDDPAVMAELEGNPEAAKAMLGADLEAMQDYLRVSYRASVNRSLEHANRSSDAQRVDATVPRDNVELYRRLHAIGLQYGPAFQLLQNVRVPPEEAA